MIKRFEGCYLAAYQDRVGVWTIGWGITSADKAITGYTIKRGLKISQETAESWLRKSLEAKYEPKVEKYNGKYEWAQNEFDALVSFCYNIGSIDQLTANGKRTKAEIAAAMLLYNHAGGKMVKGLTDRRKAEHDLFCKSYTPKDSYEEPMKTVTSKEQAKAKGITDYICSGDGVRWFQQGLKQCGYDIGPSGVDGQCGKCTVAAIKALQKDAKITVDGLGGKNTRQALKAALNGNKKPTKPVDKPHIVTVKGKTVTIDGKSLTVYNQHKLTGKYAKNISSNGCGACCTAFALTLKGKETTPAKIVDKGIALWGKWPRGCLLAAPGIATVIEGYGIPAKYYSVSSKNRDNIQKVIDKALKAGKQVVCWTNDNGLKGDPFAKGQHYVLAVGYNAAGKIVVANSGGKGPVNLVSLSILIKFLQNGTGENKRWWQSVSKAAGIVVVG